MTTAHRPTFDPVRFISTLWLQQKLTDHRPGEKKLNVVQLITNVYYQRIPLSSFGTSNLSNYPAISTNQETERKARAETLRTKYETSAQSFYEPKQHISQRRAERHLTMTKKHHQQHQSEQSRT